MAMCFLDRVTFHVFILTFHNWKMRMVNIVENDMAKARKFLFIDEEHWCQKGEHGLKLRWWGTKEHEKTYKK